MSSSQISRRALAGLLAAPALRAQLPAGPAPDESHIGSLYPFVQKQADSSPVALSFLRPEFRSLKEWQPRARRRVFQLLHYAPPPVKPEPQLVRRTDRGDYVEEYLTFRTTPDVRVPAYVLVPKNAKRAPGIVALHDHGGFYLWGKEKIVAQDGEHPALTEFRNRYYGGRGITAELARRGYVVVAIDMFYWGERRLLYGADPPAIRNRTNELTNDDISAFNRRCQQNEQLVARSLFAAGITWPGVILWDDIRAVDYLASRPEVDPQRLGCVGLSVGGYYSYLLSALEPRIKAAVAVGWMTSYPHQIKRQVINTIGLTFHIPGLYRDLDYPDLAALTAPRALMVINGSQDGLFHPGGVKAAFEKVNACFKKAGAADRVSTRMYDAPHQFNLEMQGHAWEWLKKWI